MNPDVVLAIPTPVESGELPPAAAPRLLRMARGELVSVHAELRALLYAGVLLLTGGVGLLVRQNLDRIGPVAIATALGLAAAAALAWVARVAPPFSWQEVASPNLAFDYILLLGILLVAADLAYCEVQLGFPASHRAWAPVVLAAVAGTGALRRAGAALAGVAYRPRRFPLFAYGVVAAYAGVTRLLAELSHDAALGCLWFGASSALIIAGLLAVYRRMGRMGRMKEHA